MANKFEGVITALITPFLNGEVDHASFRKLMRAQVEAGVRGFVINGTTGESPTLSLDEVRELFEIAREETSLPLILGTGSNSTAKTIETTRELGALKPDAVLVVVPYYNKPPQRGLQKHFEAVADASPVPVILYNVPGRTITTLEPKTVGLLSKHPNIIGIKDATGDAAILTQLKQTCVPDFVYLSGDDATCVDFVGAGGHGVIAVASHVIGREMSEALRDARDGDATVASLYREKYSALFKWLYIEANPIPVKKAAQLRGLIASAEMRLPLVELEPNYAKELEACLNGI